MSSKKILIICNSDLSREPRVIRQIIALKEEYEIHTLGANPSNIKSVRHFDLDINEGPSKHLSYPLFIRKTFSAAHKIYDRFRNLYLDHYFENDYWTPKKLETVKKFKSLGYDLIIAHHWDALPIAAEIANSKTKLVFNAHDYYTKEFEHNKLWMSYVQKLVTYLMKKYLPKFDLVFAAWDKIKEDYTIDYRVPSVVINNATEYNDLLPVIKNDGESIKIIHHGIANSDRQIEKMIEVMDHLDENFQFDLMLVYNDHEKEYLRSLQEKASKNKNIRFIPTVPTREIAKHINSYDVGLFLLPPNGFNPTYTLPNKIFEFLQGRLACVVTPNIEMKKVVEQYEIGWVTTDFEIETVANTIKNLTQTKIAEKKLNAHKYAKELCAENNYVLIRKHVNELLKNTMEVETFSNNNKLEKVN